MYAQFSTEMTSEEFIVWIYIFIKEQNRVKEFKEFLYSWGNLLVEQEDLGCNTKSKTSKHKFCHAFQVY